MPFKIYEQVRVPTCTTTVKISVADPYDSKNKNLPKDPAINTLGKYLMVSTSYYKYTCSNIFIADLFINAELENCLDVH